MPSIESTRAVLNQPGPLLTLGEDQLFAIAFLAPTPAGPWMPSAPTLVACSSERPFTSWHAGGDPHLPGAAMEECGLVASTIVRRFSAACGLYRFAHTDGRIASNPARYV